MEMTGWLQAPAALSIKECDPVHVEWQAQWIPGPILMRRKNISLQHMHPLYSMFQ
jgi:hypothetical protein